MSIITVTGIGTDVGKTVVSAVLAEALGADYWKPVQWGTGAITDRETIKGLVSHPNVQVHPEAYSFDIAQAPHHISPLTGQELDPNKISLPITDRPLIIESTGGILVPFRRSLLMLDVLTKWESHWVIVSKNYLGSINHTLMTVEVLRQRQVPIWGIIFNGPEDPASENFILNYTGLSCLARLHVEPQIDPNTVKKYATLWKEKLKHKM
ncbi:MAG: dethiobiotin synthase [Nitrosomonas sp.]|nr:MAG: dethiobiotin synthase [Nitrosomonas sp.]